MCDGSCDAFSEMRRYEPSETSYGKLSPPIGRAESGIPLRCNYSIARYRQILREKNAFLFDNKRLLL